MGLGAAAVRADKEKADRAAAGKSNFNADKTRFIKRELLGWVCFVGSVDADKNFRGRRAGVLAEEADADRWLAGEEDVKWDIAADAAGNLLDDYANPAAPTLGGTPRNLPPEG